MQRSNISIAIAVIAILLLAGAGYGFLRMRGVSEQPLGGLENSEPEWRTYRSERLGISFRYPETYFLEEREVGNGERGHYQITLTEDTEENERLRRGEGPAREGPVAITIDAYQNNLDRQTAEEWIRGTSASNFKLSPDSRIATTTVGGREALRYRWSGLYEADAVAIALPDYIAAFTVTYIDPEDQIRGYFYRILETVSFSEAAVARR